MQGLEVALPKAVMDPHVARCLKQESTRNLFQVACLFLIFRGMQGYQVEAQLNSINVPCLFAQSPNSQPED